MPQEKTLQIRISITFFIAEILKRDLRRKKKKKRQQYSTKIKISKDCIYHFKRRAFLLYNCISPVTHKRHDHSKQQ